MVARGDTAGCRRRLAAAGRCSDRGVWCRRERAELRVRERAMGGGRLQVVGGGEGWRVWVCGGETARLVAVAVAGEGRQVSRVRLSVVLSSVGPWVCRSQAGLGRSVLAQVSFWNWAGGRGRSAQARREHVRRIEWVGVEGIGE